MKMYEESGCFDPNSMGEGTGEDSFSQLQAPVLMARSSTNNNYEENLTLSYQSNHHGDQEDVSAIEIQLQQQLGFNGSGEIENNNAHLMQQMLHDCNQGFTSYGGESNWETNGVLHEMQDVGGIELQNGHNQQHQLGFNGLTDSNGNASTTPYVSTPDLLNLLHLPSRSLLPNSSISFANNNTGMGTDNSSGSSLLYDPLFHLNLPPQPPMFRDLFQSLPTGYTLPTSNGSSLFVGVDDQREMMYHEGDGSQFENGILEFTRDMTCIGKGRESNGKMTKHFATERDRRLHLNGKFNALRSLVPSPTKADRASVVGDAIDYIKELLRTVDELKLLVEKKRCSRERSKRHKTEDSGVVESCNMKPLGDPDQSYNTPSLRSSWLQRKSKVTEVDVRIIDDEVTIKLVQKKKINCLLFVSRVLDDLQLDLHHVAGGHIGDHYSFLFNTKIYQGSSVYASAIANKLIEVVDTQYAAVPPASNY